MFGTQIDDPVTMTTSLATDLVVTGSKIHGVQIDSIGLPVDSPDGTIRYALGGVVVLTGSSI